jgi:hypothetical protein
METERLLEIRRKLLDAVDNNSNTKADLIKVIEEISKELLQLYWKS